MGLQAKLVHCLDRVSDEKGLTRTERGVIARVIADVAGQILAGRDDAELKAIYNKHSRSDYDGEEAANIKGMKSMLEDVLGVELGDDLDMSSPEELFKRVEAQMQEEWARNNADRQAWEDRRPKRKNQPNNSPKKPSNRPKSNRSANPSAKSTENWSAPCTRTGNPTHRNVTGKPP